MGILPQTKARTEMIGRGLVGDETECELGEADLTVP